MTGALDATAKAIAGTLIPNYGQAITFTAPPVQAEYDPTDGTVTDTPATYAWFGLVTTYEEAMRVRGTSKAGKLALMVPVQNAAGTAISFTPDNGWKASIHGRDRIVDKVELIAPGDAVVAYVLEFKG